MRPHLRYASYVARHKWFVFLAGRKTGAPLWRLVIHDWSKLLPSEWFPYTMKFYGNWGTAESLDDADRIQVAVNRAFDMAWLRHQHRNPHHWQHWVLREDDGDTQALRMPDVFVREMVADWMGAGRARAGQWESGKWYDANAHRIVLHPDVRALVERLIDEHGRAG
jgi:hypothetical protein